MQDLLGDSLRKVLDLVEAKLQLEDEPYTELKLTAEPHEDAITMRVNDKRQTTSLSLILHTAGTQQGESVARLLSGASASPQGHSCTLDIRPSVAHSLHPAAAQEVWNAPAWSKAGAVRLGGTAHLSLEEKRQQLTDKKQMAKQNLAALVRF